MSFWEVDQEKFQTFINDPTVSPDTKKDLSSVITKNTKYINFDLSIYINDENIFKKLTTKGALKKIQEGIPTNNYPFKKEYNCLVNNNYFRETSTKDISITKEYMLTEVHPGEKDKSHYQKTINRYFAAIDKYPQCLKTLTPSSQMSETMSDMVGSIVAEKYILENPFVDEAEKVAAIPSIESSCSPQKTPPLQPESYSPWRAQNMFKGAFADESHPQYKDRYQKLMLNLPGMAQEYGCQRKEHACFDHLSFSKRMSAANEKSDSRSKVEKGQR